MARSLEVCCHTAESGLYSWFQSLLGCSGRVPFKHTHHSSLWLREKATTDILHSMRSNLQLHSRSEEIRISLFKFGLFFFLLLLF